MQIDGGCHCGRISYQAEIDPKQVSICHCTDCQTLTGSPFPGHGHLRRGRCAADRRLPQALYQARRQRPARHQHFCGDCGTPLFTSGEDDAGEWGIRWGGIRQHDRLMPRRQIWCAPAVGWLDQITHLPGRPGD